MLGAAQVDPLIDVRSFPGRVPIHPATSTGCLSQQWHCPLWVDGG
ncbi:hypothetical protein ABID26_004107 [Mesorhizobium shonense]|uniref:Uncharacterized protein n=1 Tax=Mesorhizobium shonense TaxID=1209948 RepID=A0ABV2HWD6_9HYPH